MINLWELNYWGRRERRKKKKKEKADRESKEHPADH